MSALRKSNKIAANSRPSKKPCPVVTQLRAVANGTVAGETALNIVLDGLDALYKQQTGIVAPLEAAFAHFIKISGNTPINYTVEGGKPVPMTIRVYFSDIIKPVFTGKDTGAGICRDFLTQALAAQR